MLQRERKKRARGGRGVPGRGPRGAGGPRRRTSSDPRGVHARAAVRGRARGIIDDAIAEIGATSMRDLGRVMADVMPQVAGRADGCVVSQLVREKLA